MVIWVSSFIGIGALYLTSMAWLVLPLHWNFEIPFLGTTFRSWRLLVIIYGTPNILFAIVIYFLPESPKYLLVQGRKEEVLEILKNIFSINTGKDASEYPVSTIVWEENHEVTHAKNENIFTSMWEQTKPLIQKRYCLKTVLVCYMQFAIFFT